MKTVWEVIMVISLVLVIITGITSIGEQVFVTQPLTNESVNTLSLYSDLVSTYQNNYTKTINQSEIDPYLETDLNEVSEFVQEYRDYKGKFDQLKDGLLLIYQMPDLVLYAVPFVDDADIKDYNLIYRNLIWVLLLLLVIVGLKNGQLIPQF